MLGSYAVELFTVFCLRAVLQEIVCRYVFIKKAHAVFHEKLDDCIFSVKLL